MAHRGGSPQARFFAGLLAVAACIPAHGAQLSRYEFTEPHMGTLFRIVLYAPTAGDARAAATAAFARVGELDRICSDYDPRSELNQLCVALPGKARSVSGDLLDVLQESVAIASQTNGAFDPTVGPVVQLWRASRRTRQLPDESLRQAARDATGYTKVRIDPGGATVTLLSARMQLDLGGIAKGFAADAALAVLVRRGLSHAMVAASGDIALGDAPPDVPGWKIETTPFGPKGPRQMFLAANVGISSSGDETQFTEIDGRRYSHIVDPRTGLGLVDSAAVTVIAPTATRSDGFATAFSVLSLEETNAVVSRSPGPMRVIVTRREADASIAFGAFPAGVTEI